MKIAVSIGDMNGIGAQIALTMHKEIKFFCEPVYFVDKVMIEQAASLLGVDIPEDFQTIEIADEFKIEPSKISSKSGKYSYLSFKKAVDYVSEKKADAVVTLPIHKEAWSRAGIEYKGHTDMLRDIFKQDAIMMLGKPGFYVALYTEHIPYKDVPAKIEEKRIVDFLLTLQNETKEEKIAVLGLNPHSGDGGVLGDEDFIISKACESANGLVNKNIFEGAIVPDTAFTPHMRQKYMLFVAMYHDQGLAPLKALYFDESINVSLNLPIVRTSVDHGTAFDIAYTGIEPNTQSYLNAIKEAINLTNRKSAGI